MDSSAIKGRENPLLYWALLWIGLPAGLIALAALFWTSGSPNAYRAGAVERWIEPLTTTRFDRDGFAALAGNMPPNFSAARWEPVALPDSTPLPASAEVDDATPMARAWFRLRYRIPADAAPMDGVAVHGTRAMGGAYAVWANGELLQVNLRDWALQYNLPIYVPLPPDMAVPGHEVDIAIGLPFRVNQGYAMGSLFVGPTDAITALHERRMLFQQSLPQTATWMMLLMGILSLHLWWARRQNSANLLLTLAALAFFICNLQFFHNVSDNASLYLWYNAVVDASVSWVLMLIFLFAFRFDHRHFPRIEKALLLYTLAVTLVTLPVWDWEKSALLLQHWLNIGIGIGIACLLTWLSLRKASLEFRLIAMSIWILMLFGLYDIAFVSSQAQPDGFFLFPYATIAVSTAFIFASQRQHVGALAAVEELNASLSDRLSAKERELHAKHEQLLAMEKSRTLLLERQRLVRDMHDGIGSALMGSLVMAERGELSRERMTDALRECLDDLKAVIDSLEPVGKDLSTLLGTLRQRYQGRLENAGIVLEWRMGETPPLDWLHPPQALHVLRIVQELLTNVLKHARADRVLISTDMTNLACGEKAVELAVADNGIGFDIGGSGTGRGLTHIQERAKVLTGALLVVSTPGKGTRIALRMPICGPSDETNDTVKSSQTPRNRKT